MVLRLLVFLLAAGFGLGNRQFEHHLQAMWQHIFGGNAALVLLDDVLGNRQAQACAIAGAAAVGAEKCGEYVRQLGFVYAMPLSVMLTNNSCLLRLQLMLITLP